MATTLTKSKLSTEFDSSCLLITSLNYLIGLKNWFLNINSNQQSAKNKQSLKEMAQHIFKLWYCNFFKLSWWAKRTLIVLNFVLLYNRKNSTTLHTKNLTLRFLKEKITFWFSILLNISKLKKLLCLECLSFHQGNGRGTSYIFGFKCKESLKSSAGPKLQRFSNFNFTQSASLLCP